MAVATAGVDMVVTALVMAAAVMAGAMADMEATKRVVLPSAPSHAGATGLLGLNPFEYEWPS
ncbi:hypothetical protein [Tardiphaga sp.]|uniref:hypothetical protein n=1 Tax=Tardiphaga sp. TaxID=1926292 RepID=UPI00352BAB6D